MAAVGLLKLTRAHRRLYERRPHVHLRSRFAASDRAQGVTGEGRPAAAPPAASGHRPTRCSRGSRRLQPPRSSSTSPGDPQAARASKMLDKFGFN